MRAVLLLPPGPGTWPGADFAPGRRAGDHPEHAPEGKVGLGRTRGVEA
jgi:hypothetical protein